MLLQLINDVKTLKSTDNATAIEMAIVDEQKQRVELSQYETIIVNIGTNGTLYSSEIPEINSDTNTFSFTLSHDLQVGVYQIQVHLTTEDGKLHIAPHKGAETLTIEKSFNEIGETVTVMSIQKLLDDMASTLRVAEEANDKSNDAIAKAESAINTATIATTDASTAVTIANDAKAESATANTNASNAVSTADDALALIQQANNTSNTASQNASSALSIANTAKITADNAESKATTATSTANTAKNTADTAKSTAEGLANSIATANQNASDAKSIAQQVRNEFDDLTTNDTGAELINARTDESSTVHATLKARIDSEANKRSTGDANTLKSAKDYTDSKVGNIDFTNFVQKDGSKVLSDNNYTTAEKNKLSGISENANNYSLPNATSSVLGGVKVGTNVSVSSGTISVANSTTSAKGVVQLTDSTSSTSTTTAATANAVKQAYDLANTVKTTAESKTDDTALNTHLADYMPHDSALSQYASSVDANGIYKIVTFKRADGTIYMTSTASNADANGNYRTFTWKFYAENGTTLKLTKTWTVTYDSNNVATAKVVS